MPDSTQPCPLPGTSHLSGQQLKIGRSGDQPGVSLMSRPFRSGLPARAGAPREAMGSRGTLARQAKYARQVTK